MTEQFLEKNGIYYRVNDFDHTKKTLVFVHGLTGSSSAWVKYEEKFHEHFNILTFDLRGHGKSKRYKHYEDYGLNKFAEDIYELTSHLRIEKFILISHSFGTLLALEYLRLYPHFATSALFFSPVHGLKKAWWYRYVRSLNELIITFFRFFPFYKTTGVHIDYDKYPNSSDWSLRRLVADLSNTSIRIYVYCLKHIYAYPHDNYWRELKMPVLVLHGKKDTISPVHEGIAVAEMIPDSKLVLLDDANHIVVLNNFDEVSEAISSFVSEKE